MKDNEMDLTRREVRQSGYLVPLPGTLMHMVMSSCHCEGVLPYLQGVAKVGGECWSVSQQLGQLVTWFPFKSLYPFSCHSIRTTDLAELPCV